MNLTRETDFGTPASSLEETVTIEIDGLPATVKKGSTIMRAARESGVDVPKLCATDNLEPFGSCRLCLVEIEGRKGYPASCTTPVEEGMQVRTQTDALGYPMNYTNEAEIMDEIATLTPTFQGVSFDFLDRFGSVQWPCNEKAPMGTPIMHVNSFVRGKGMFVETDYVPTEERTNRRFPLLLTTGRTLTQYNVGAQTRRTANVVWYKEDLLEIHPHDAETRGINEGDRVSLTSRKGDITLSAKITDRVQPGVIYTTFHDPETGANVVTTEYSDWATDCPEYKVTAVQVAPAVHRSKWQDGFEQRAQQQGKVLDPV